jgi:Holliday junction resolvasome RuvABC endonuclease subunit
MTKVLAFDPATTTGWTFGGTSIDLPDWSSGHFKAPKRPEEGERLIIIEDGALGLIRQYEPDLIVFEEPYDPTQDMIRELKAGKPARMLSNQKTIHFLQRVKGAILMAAARSSLPTEGYWPRSWRATLRLPKRPDGADSQWIKKATRDAVQRMGATAQTFDECDAWGLCFHAIHGKPGVERATNDLFERAREGL